MIIETLCLVARRSSRRELETALCFLLGPTQVQAGCVACHLYQDLSNPNSFRFECVWQTEADLVSHLRSETYRQFLILMELSAEQPLVQFHTIANTQGLELVHATRKSSPEFAEHRGAGFPVHPHFEPEGNPQQFEPD
jgi:quinol monooxygenase YgiN